MRDMHGSYCRCPSCVVEAALTPAINEYGIGWVIATLEGICGSRAAEAQDRYEQERWRRIREALGRAHAVILSQEAGSYP
jgi:hypothetical protein